MFIPLIFTLPLNDETRGRRFNIFNQKGFFRLRKYKSRGWFKNEVGDTFSQYHFGKLTIAFERKIPARQLRHFAG